MSRATQAAVLTLLAAQSPAVLAGDSNAAPALCGNGSLEILLTNDDGYQAPGIRALYDALRKAGHRVRLVAPVANASGSSTSFTWSEVRIVRDPADPDVIGVTATPATAAVLGSTALYPAGRRPDLVVSGINNGQNAGTLLAVSGTVGAALAGTILVDPPIPGISVNAQRAAATDGRAGLPPDHLQTIAAHFAQLVSIARGWFCESGAVARATTVLNVNYPAIPLASARGVAAARQSRIGDLHIAFQATGPDTYEVRELGASTTAQSPDSDVALLGKGYVTVTPISAMLDVGDAPLRDLEQRLGTAKF